MENNTLQHHGVIGMRWGVRRYQNKDGTLTSAGKKRYDKEMDKLKKEEKVLKNKQRTEDKIKKLDAKRQEVESLKKKQSEDKPDPKKNVRELSDDELRARVARLQLEKQYKDLSPKQVSKGQKLTNTILNDVILPGAIDVGKQLIKSAMVSAANKAFDLDDEHKVHTNNKKK